MATDLTQRLDEETKRAQAQSISSLGSNINAPQASATKPASPQSIASGVPNFGDDSQAGLNKRLEFMQSQNGSASSPDQGSGVQPLSKQASQPQSISAGVNFGDDSMKGLQTRLSAMQAANGNQAQPSEPQAGQSIANAPTLSGIATPGKVNYGDDSIAGLNKSIAALQESNGTKPTGTGDQAITAGLPTLSGSGQGSTMGQAIGAIGKSLSNAAGAVLNAVVPSASAAETTTATNRPLLSDPNPGKVQAGASTQSQPSNIIPMSGQGTATAIGSFSQGGKSYNIADLGEGGIRKVTSAGTSPLYTNIDPGQAVQEIAKLKPSPVGPLAAQGYATSAGLESMARANDIRQSMIDQRDQREGINSPGAVMEDSRVAESNARLDASRRGLEDQQLIAQLKTLPSKRALAVASTYAAGRKVEAEGRSDDASARMATERNAVLVRGQDITARGQDIGLQRGADRNEVLKRGQDLRADTAADRIASSEKIAEARTNARQGPSLSQQRGNAEIDAARKQVAGLTTDEIRRRTAPTTATGRENPDFDPALARAAKQASRRKVGTDDWFDQQQSDESQADEDKSIMRRFMADGTMKGHSLGKRTPLGMEVLDSSGKILGHYR